MPAYYLAISSLCDDYVKNMLKNNVQSVIIESSRDIFVGVVMANSNTKKWWKNAIIYQIYPGSFCDSNGDGIGDISGIISKLHTFKEFGVDAIWLGPVFASPNFSNGYDISDYKSINPDFGTMEDMEKLISRAKRLGMKIIMDLVIKNCKLIGHGGEHYIKVEDGKIQGVFEHHTRDLTPQRLEELVLALADGTIRHEDVHDEGGHGAFALNPISKIEKVVVAGPKRALIEDTNLDYYHAAPGGDVMMTGTVGLVKSMEFLRKN